jgi:hypothetical protein
MPTYKIDDARIHILGRYEESDGSLFFDNVVSGIEIEFKGTALSLLCRTIPRPRINKNYPMFTILSVMVDGCDPLRIMSEIHNEELSEVEVANGLENKWHHAVIMKTDDPLISTFVLSGVVAEELADRNNKRKKLLVYGDSITAGGDNAIIAGPSLDVVPGTGIGTYTYATLFALMADMEISVFAQCGMPLGNFTGDKTAVNMMDIYTHISPQNQNKWDMKRFIPDLIVINLGTNDELGREFDYAEFAKLYEKFIRELNAYYKNKKYLLICGQMNKSERLVEAVFQVAQDLSDEGITAFAYKTKKARRGHPNVFEHKELAEELFCFAKKASLI